MISQNPPKNPGPGGPQPGGPPGPGPGPPGPISRSFGFLSRHTKRRALRTEPFNLSKTNKQGTFGNDYLRVSARKGYSVPLGIYRNNRK